MTSCVRDNMQARAAALLADKYADPWLKLARYEVLTDDLLARLDEAVNYLRRVVQADRDDTKMGYPIPGDSCLAACIGLEVMRFLDEVGALTDGVGTDGKRTVGVMAGSNEAASLPEAGRSPTPSVSAPDIDALADTVREGFTFVLQADDGPVIKVGEAADRGSEAALSDLVASAKEAENQRDYWIECDEYSRERADVAESENKRLKDEILRACQLLPFTLSTATSKDYKDDHVLLAAYRLRAVLASVDPKEGTP